MAGCYLPRMPPCYPSGRRRPSCRRRTSPPSRSRAWPRPRHGTGCGRGIPWISQPPSVTAHWPPETSASTIAVRGLARDARVVERVLDELGLDEPVGEGSFAACSIARPCKPNAAKPPPLRLRRSRRRVLRCSPSPSSSLSHGIRQLLPGSSRRSRRCGSARAMVDLVEIGRPPDVGVDTRHGLRRDAGHADHLRDRRTDGLQVVDRVDLVGPDRPVAVLSSAKKSARARARVRGRGTGRDALHTAGAAPNAGCRGRGTPSSRRVSRAVRPGSGSAPRWTEERSCRPGLLARDDSDLDERVAPSCRRALSRSAGCLWPQLTHR